MLSPMTSTVSGSKAAREGKDAKIVLASMLSIAALLSSSGSFLSASASLGNMETNAQLVSEVSGERMMDTILDLEGFGSRAFYLNSSREAAEYIHSEFAELGLDVQFDEFAAGNHTVANVVATLGGSSDAKERLLVGAHYDSENLEAENASLGTELLAPGADDDASGVAAVLELARVLSAHPIDRVVQFVAFGAEENGYDQSGGLAGSNHFAFAEKERGTEYEATAILDMIGYRGAGENHVVAVVNEEDSVLAERMKDGIRDYNITVEIAVVRDPQATYSDHYSFWLAGYPSILLIEGGSGSAGYALNPYYHTANDTSNALSQEQITETTRALLAGILELVEPDVKDRTLVIVLATVGIAVVTLAVAYLYLRSRKVGST